jgi:hypothetical protein
MALLGSLKLKLINNKAIINIIEIFILIYFDIYYNYSYLNSLMYILIKLEINHLRLWIRASTSISMRETG